MKYGMPRKIDDIRRNRVIGTCLVLALLATAAWFGYEAWMRPYRVRRARLAGVIREGEAFLARFDEILTAADPKELGGAWTRMNGLAGVADREAAKLPGFSLDTELYVLEDRMKAERLLEEYSASVAEYASGGAARRAAATEAAGLAEGIGRLLDGAPGSSAADARSDLEQSLLELKAVHLQVRPTVEAASAAEKRYNAAQNKAAEARAQMSKWTSDAQQALADAASIAMEMADAERRTKEAFERARALRNEGLSLQIDQNSAKLTTLQNGLKKGEEDVAKALDAYRGTKRALDAALGDIQKQAREKCQAARDAIQRLASEHGSLLPEDKVKTGSNALEEVEAAIREHNATWMKLGEQGNELVGQAETLRSEAGGIIVQLENAQQKGEMGVDGVRASTLPGELAAIRGKLAAAETALGTDALERQLDSIVTRATSAMKAVQAAKPDIPRLVAGIRKEAENSLEEIDRAQSEKDRIENLVRDGRGAAKSTLEQALAACRHPDAAEEELLRLAKADAENGRGILVLRSRLAKAQESARTFSATVGKIGQDQKTAEQAGRFFPVSWEEGAIGWEPGKPGVVTDQDESVLIPIYSGTEGKSYTWEFDYPFESAGEHRIEVRVAKPGIAPVNESIERLKKALHEGQSVNGGWVGVGCRLETSSETWYDELWIPNYNKLSPAETVVSGSGKFPAGYQTFTLTLNLAASPVTGNNWGWHPGRLAFTVFVDGRQVQRFWHKAR